LTAVFFEANHEAGRIEQPASFFNFRRWLDPPSTNALCIESITTTFADPTSDS